MDPDMASGSSLGSYVIMTLSGSTGHSDQLFPCDSSALGHENDHILFMNRDLRQPRSLFMNNDIKHGSEIITKTPAVVGPWTQTWL